MSGKINVTASDQGLHIFIEMPLAEATFHGNLIYQILNGPGDTRSIHFHNDQFCHPIEWVKQAPPTVERALSRDEHEAIRGDVFRDLERLRKGTGYRGNA